MQKLKLTSLALIMFASLSSNAQTPEKKSKALVLKFTETWCGPCGDWGWETAEETIAQLGDKGYYIGVMGSSTPTSMNANCYSTLESNFPVGGYPTFAVGQDGSSQYATQIMALVNPIAANTNPAASAAAKYTISGTTINVTAKAKFWAATTGEYYMAAYLVEDSVLAAQNGQTGIVAHHHILRGTMSTNLSPWGEMIATGSVANNAEFTKTYSIAIASEWKKPKLEVYIILYKKNGTKYDIVNVEKAKSNTTSIAEIKGLSSIQLFPNPSNGNAQLQALINENMNLSVRVTDPVGRVVYASEPHQLIAGNNNIIIPSQNFANGVYFVSLINSEGQINTQRLVILK